MKDQWELTKNQEKVFEQIKDATEDGMAVPVPELEDRKAAKALAEAKIVTLLEYKGIELAHMHFFTENDLGEQVGLPDLDEYIDTEDPESSEEDKNSEQKDSSDNTASSEDSQNSEGYFIDEEFLTDIKGIGQSTAEDIVEHLQDEGVNQWDEFNEMDFSDLPGISESRAENIEEKIQKSDKTSIEQSVDKLKSLKGN